MKTGDVVTAVAQRLDADGLGETDDGLKLKGLLPGESAKARIDHVSPHRDTAWGTVLERLGPPSANRCERICPARSDCGGCQLQHLTGATQLALKRSRVAAALAEVGINEAVAAALPSPQEQGYRNKGKYVVGHGANGKLTLGTYAPRSHRLVSTLGCRVVAPEIDDAAQLCARALAACELSAYDETTREGSLRYVLIRAGADARMVVTIVTTSDADRSELSRVASQLLGEGAISGVSWAQNDRTDGGLLAEPTVPLAGDPWVGELVGGVMADVAPTAFWQINREQAARIYERIAALTSGKRILELYAGVGAIGLAAAALGSDVTTVEIDPDAVAVTTDVAKRIGVSLIALAGDASIGFGHEAETIIVNPPRRGLAVEIIESIIASNAVQLIYLSCEPRTLAADLVRLVDGGGVVETIEPFDMMPGTAHVETLVSVRLLAAPAAPH